jgi:DNA invertase Pin-like site-specific DNA recombinase
MEQLNSLFAQVSGLTRLVVANPTWLLKDIYMDVASGKEKTRRPGFARMMADCTAHSIDIVVAKNISRFGRDTVEVIGALNQLKALNIRAIFDEEKLDTADTSSDIMVACMEAIAQAENESRSKNIKMGIEQRAESGISGLFNRRCYGYAHDSKGNLVIDEVQAKTVRTIYDLYLKGKSVQGIIKELETYRMHSPTGKERWSKKSVENVLSNEKYIGSVRLFDIRTHKAQYLSEDNHPPIITAEVFKAVQLEKNRRSNIIRDDSGTKRKSTKYSSKHKAN